MPLNATIPRPIPEEFVPPFATGRIPVISLAPPARLIAEEEMRPATEWRTPVPSAPKLMVPFAWRAEVEARREAVSAVVEARESWEAWLVEVAIKYSAVGVLVEMYDVPLNATTPKPIPVELVPPRMIGSVPVKSEVERSREAEEETAPPVVRRIPLVSQFKLSPMLMFARVEDAKADTVRAVVEAKVTVPFVAFKF